MTTKATRLHRILGKQHFKKAYLREDGLITHHSPSDDIVSHQRRTERESFEIAADKVGVKTPPTHKGGVDANEGKKCSKCKHWRKLQYFGTKRVMNKHKVVKVYYQSWCNMCMAEWAQEQYRQSVLTLRG